MAHDERRAVELLDHVSDRECLTGSGHAEQHLRVCAGVDAVNQRLYRLRLVTRGLVWRFELKHFRYYVITSLRHYEKNKRDPFRDPFELLNAALLDAGFLTRTLAEVVQFGTTYFTVLVDSDALDEGAVHREDTLNTYVAAHLANCEAFLVAATMDADYITAELLNTLFVTFFDTITNGYLVTCLECREFFFLTGKSLLGYFQ